LEWGFTQQTKQILAQIKQQYQKTQRMCRRLSKHLSTCIPSGYEKERFCLRLAYYYRTDHESIDLIAYDTRNGQAVDSCEFENRDLSETQVTFPYYRQKIGTTLIRIVNKQTNHIIMFHMNSQHSSRYNLSPDARKLIKYCLKQKSSTLPKPTHR
jgi:hypothetical protein